MEVANISMQEVSAIFEAEKDYDSKIDELELYMSKFPLVECPVKHVFTDFLYTRTIFMPAGTIVVSMIHRCRHQYIVLSGSAWVFIDGEWEHVEAPYMGITEAGTRRVLYIEKDCIWSTGHVIEFAAASDSEEDVAEAVMSNFDNLYVKRVNPLLGGMMINNKLTKLIEQ
jgi:hypothetical protein